MWVKFYAASYGISLLTDLKQAAKRSKTLASPQINANERKHDRDYFTLDLGLSLTL